MSNNKSNNKRSWHSDDVPVKLKTLQRWKKRNINLNLSENSQFNITNDNINHQIISEENSILESNSEFINSNTDINLLFSESSIINKQIHDFSLINLPNSGHNWILEELLNSCYNYCYDENNIEDDEDDKSLSEDEDFIINIDEDCETDESYDNDYDNENNFVNNDINIAVLYRNLHENTHTQLIDAIIGIMDFKYENKIGFNGLKKQLKLLDDFFLPDDHELPKTPHYLYKVIETVYPSPKEIKNYYCRKCFEYIGTELPDKCKSCSSSSFHFFFEFDIVEQIQYLFKYRKLSDVLNNKKIEFNNPDAFCGIEDGSEYKRIKECIQEDELLLTIIKNSDGVRFSNSSNTCVWPLMYTIAEIPAHLRKSYTQVCGIWCDDIKPVMNTYLLPFCKKLKKYFNEVIICENEIGEKFKIKIVAPLWVADAPARAIIINLQNHNGTIPCKTCETESVQYEVIRKNKKPKKRRYLPTNPNPKIRSHEKMIQDGITAVRMKTPVNGVKGLTYICILPLLDLSTCLIPELMHSMFLGIFKMFMLEWFTTNNKCSLKNHINEINEIISTIQVSPDTKRLLRQVMECDKFKASEFYDWLLTYSIPILSPFMKPEYLQHHLLLVSAMEIFLSNQILKLDSAKADIMIRSFIRDAPELYSYKMLTYNLHQAGHYHLNTSRWGPLGSLTAFSYEDINGLLVSITHGSKNIGQEIVNSYKIQQSFTVLKEKRKNLNVQSQTLNEDNTKVLGKPLKCTEELVKILKCVEMHDIENIKCYSRAIIKNEECISTFYKEVKKNSSTFYIILNNQNAFYGTALFYFVYKNVMFICLNILYKIKDPYLINIEMNHELKNIFKVKTAKTAIFNINSIQKIKSVTKIKDYICIKPDSYMYIL